MPIPEELEILFEMPYLAIMIVLFVLVILGIVLTIIWIRRRVMWMIISALLILALNSILGAWVLPLISIANEQMRDVAIIMGTSMASQTMSLISHGILWLFTVKMQDARRI